MRCNKCNSPLISGEPFCKICGTKFEDQKDLEVIDFDLFEGEEEFVNEVLDNSEDLMDELEDVKLETTVSLEPVSLELEATKKMEKVEETKVEEAKEEVKEEMVIDLEDDEKPEMSQTLIDIMMKPIVLEDTIKMDSKDIKVEEVKLEEKAPEEKVEETKVEEVKEEKVETKEEEIEVLEPLEDTKQVFKRDPKKLPKKEIKAKEHEVTKKEVKPLKLNNNKKGADLTVVILALVLLVSIVLNVFLFVTGGSNETEGSETTTIVKTNTVVFGGYEISVNNGWLVSNVENTLVLSDTSNEWVSKTITVENSNYDAFVSNVDTFIEELKNQKYQFTSNYEKKVDGSKLYIFKGKFESYTTYLIVGSIDKETLSVTELKFENEVNDKTLDKVMSTITSIEVSNAEFEALESEKLTKSVQDNSVLKEVEEDTTDTEEE